MEHVRPGCNACGNMSSVNGFVLEHSRTHIRLCNKCLGELKDLITTNHKETKNAYRHKKESR
jgi:hypothetical protein